MTESQFQTKLLKALRQHPALKDAVIFKHSDRVNGGIPDASITICNGITNWFELKVEPNKLTKLQAFYLSQMGTRGHIVKMITKGNLKGAIVIDSQPPFFLLLEQAVERIVILCVNQ